MKPQDAAGAPAPPFPAASLEAIEAVMCAPGARYEMEVVEVEGRPTRTWKNQPPNLPTLARLARAGYGARTFLVHEDERVSFEGWFRAGAALAQALAERGVGRGDRVALAMRNLPEWPVVFFATTSLGAIITPLNAWWTGEELAYGLGHSGARVLVCDSERWARIAPHRGALGRLEHVLVARAGEGGASGAEPLEALIGQPAGYGTLPERDLPAVEIAPDDPATLFYTSGTTGRPKGALGTHRNILTCTLNGGYVAERGYRRRGETPPEPTPKVTLMVIPLFHVTACHAALIGAVAAGNSLVFMGRWEPVKAMGLIESERVNITGGVPFIAWQLLEHPERSRFDLSSLEAIAYGGAPSAPELARRIQLDLGAQPGNGWGMTETSATVTNHVGEDYLNRPDSCGPPLPVAELKIMAEDGVTKLPVGEVGELWAYGPQVLHRYWEDAEATARTFVDGWVRTGDLARLDAEGFCYIVDRAKDVIIRGGENIYATEVENVLYAHPEVMDAALVGLPHRTLGEEPAAVVRLTPGATADEAELQAWVRKRLAAFKTPVRVRIQADALPRNANGKVLKAELKRGFEAEGGS